MATFKLKRDDERREALQREFQCYCSLLGSDVLQWRHLILRQAELLLESLMNSQQFPAQASATLSIYQVFSVTVVITIS